MSDWLICPNCWSCNVDYGDSDTGGGWFECLDCGVSGHKAELVEDADDDDDDECWGVVPIREKL